ncbi:MAG: hypothetical protein WCE45_05800 [Sedimentisphaerales bacterium]
MSGRYLFVLKGSSHNGADAFDVVGNTWAFVSAIHVIGVTA